MSVWSCGEKDVFCLLEFKSATQFYRLPGNVRDYAV
jgi:hypothetical protein